MWAQPGSSAQKQCLWSFNGAYRLLIKSVNESRTDFHRWHSRNKALLAFGLTSFVVPVCLWFCLASLWPAVLQEIRKRRNHDSNKEKAAEAGGSNGVSGLQSLGRGPKEEFRNKFSSLKAIRLGEMMKILPALWPLRSPTNSTFRITIWLIFYWFLTADG